MLIIKPIIGINKTAEVNKSLMGKSIFDLIIITIIKKIIIV